MDDAKTQRSGCPAILWASAVLFGLFAVQSAYQIYRAYRNHLDVNADLSAELADAVFLEDEPAPASADWPQWRGPHRDGLVHMDDLASEWPKEGPPLLWQKNIGLGYSSFAVKDGRFYSLFQQGNKEVVACWRVQDGEEVWRREYDCHADVHDYPGPRSTPTLDGDRLYTAGSNGKLLCLNAATGSPHWQKDLLTEFHASPPKWGVAFSPLIDGDLVFTSPGGRNGNSVAAFNKITGELVWKRLDDPPGYSSPVAVTIAGTRQVLFFMGESLVAVRARDGELCWRYPWATSYEVNAATPLVFHARRGDEILHYVFISSGYGRGCALLKIAPVVGGGFEAKKVYSGKQMCSHFASPVRHGKYLYGIDDSRLACLNLRTGKVMWTRSGCNKGSLLRVNDCLLVLGEEGKLWLLDASPEKLAPKAEARPFRGGRCWTMPVLAEGKLFLRNERQMKCYDMTKSQSREESPRGR
ncbi:MAG TPA: PQQ-binding-like beta-propeller repeat protein [Gemmataceae bacterium]|nr:PQQ-binding-like beta-propeller repeat protein [Gemmataceae bacterium]